MATNGIQSKGTRHSILCTGGLGYIGSHTVVQLLDRGFTVGILDNLCNSSLEVLRRIRIVTNKEEEDPTFQFFNIDLRDEAALKKLFEENRFDAVIHYAGLKSVSESLQLALDYYSTNVGGTLNLLRAMDATGCRRLVFSSSAAVYKLKAERIVETDPLGAATPYGRTKMMIEQILQDLHASDRRWRISILRYFNPVGAHASGLLGESPDLPSNLVPFLQHVAVGRQPHLNVFGTDWDTPDGTGVRDFVHVDDLAEGHIAALCKLEADENGCCMVHNLGTGRGHSVLEMADIFERVSGRKIPRKSAPRRPGDLSSVIADPSLAEKELGWKARRTMEDAVASAWKWQFGNPDGYNTPVEK